MHSATGIDASDRSQLQAEDPSQHNLPTTLHALVQEIRSRVHAGEQKSKLAEEYGISRQTLYTAIGIEG
jgi:DNA-binding phage protein